MPTASAPPGSATVITGTATWSAGSYSFPGGLVVASSGIVIVTGAVVVTAPDVFVFGRISGGLEQGQLRAARGARCCLRGRGACGVGGY
jgi:hypothetical protein